MGHIICQAHSGEHRKKENKRPKKPKFFLRSFNAFRIRRRRQWRQWSPSIRRRGDRIIKRCNYVLFIFIYCTLYFIREESRAYSRVQQFHWFIVDKYPKLFTRLSTLSRVATGGQWADHEAVQWKLINIINHKIKYHLY